MSRFVPSQSTNSQSSSFVSCLNLLIPIPEYAAASSNVRLLFSQIGTSFIKVLLFLQNIIKRLTAGPFPALICDRVFSGSAMRISFTGVLHKDIIAHYPQNRYHFQRLFKFSRCSEKVNCI